MVKVVVRIIYRMSEVIIKEVVVEIEVIIMQEKMVCNLLRRLPRLMIELIFMPF